MKKKKGLVNSAYGLNKPKHCTTLLFAHSRFLYIEIYKYIYIYIKIKNKKRVKQFGWINQNHCSFVTIASHIEQKSVVKNIVNAKLYFSQYIYF